MSETTTIALPDVEAFKQRALQWANHFKVVCLLDSNQYTADKYSTKDWVLGIDQVKEFNAGAHVFERLKCFHQSAGAPVFGFFTYDLKNQVEQLSSTHADHIGFPEVYFFEPRYLLEIKDNKLTVNRNYPETFELLEVINKMPLIHPAPPEAIAGPVKMRTGKRQYLSNVQHIRRHIEEGDFYELTYCNEFYAEHTVINPLFSFYALNQKARAPFSTFFKWNNHYLLCASPERFLKKEGSRLISQPIKGTIRKGNTEAENARLRSQLQNDVKERAENVMIVDLVRNDFARSALPGSVKVEELFGIYDFNSVIQMISTVTAELLPDVHFTDAIKNAFPMGSMTGAPKVTVMEHIEKYENFKRGLYSGSVGYITPQGNFDFNVVIRSILYNGDTGYLSLPVGGAITYDSVPEQEYEETLLKATNMLQVLGATLRHE